MKIAVISDIHSAAEHFRDAVGCARDEGFDQLVILGDLFTYGPDPVETLDIAHDVVTRDRAILITGNHDLLYLQSRESDAYASQLPDWIKESVEWTAAQLSRRHVDELRWQAEWEESCILFSHANPFGFGDWTYLSDERSMSAASDRLQDRGFDWGVFGHVHRFRRFVRAGGGGGVVTIGSIGQPRDRAEPFSQWAVVTTVPKFRTDQRRVARDWTSTVNRIRATPLSAATKQRLCKFYR